MALCAPMRRRTSHCAYAIVRGEGVYRAKLNPSKFGCNARVRSHSSAQRVAVCVCGTPRTTRLTYQPCSRPCSARYSRRASSLRGAKAAYCSGTRPRDPERSDCVRSNIEATRTPPWTDTCGTNDYTHIYTQDTFVANDKPPRYAPGKIALKRRDDPLVSSPRRAERAPVRPCTHLPLVMCLR